MRNSNRLGCLSGTGVFAAIFTSLLVGVYVYMQGGLLYNPGPLNSQRGEVLGGVTSHEEIGGDCEACHTAPWESATMADRCVVCHASIGAQMMAVATIHGSMKHDNPDLTCRHCHPEHRGPDARLTEMVDAEFPHELVGYSLKGHQVTVKGEAFVCFDCHGDDITTFDLSSCAACHSQIEVDFMPEHVSAYGEACLDCHDGVDGLGKMFTHEQLTFRLVGKHQGLACMKCHTGARTLNDFTSVPQDCYSCHLAIDPHEYSMGTDCAACHTTEGWLPATFDHALSLFPLEDGHKDVLCEKCHVDRVYKGTPMDCYSCHKGDDEHDGRFGPDCAICHSPAGWDELTFDHNEKYALTGRHVGVPCERCHVDYKFAGISRTCAGCHGDPSFHVGLFGFDCLSCHTTNNWFARYTGRHPGLGDEGGNGLNHEGASCRDCHTKSLHTATCDACHNGNNFDDSGDGGDGGGDDD